MLRTTRLPRFASQRVHRLTILVSLCLAGSVALANPAGAATSWTAAGNLALARLGPSATALADGRVLVTGGNTAVGDGYDTKLAEIYSPATNSWSSTGSTTNGRDQGHTATKLPNGKVLVTGGVNANICASDNTAELYDPATGTWGFTGSLSTARYFATATPLTNGKILVVGGGDRCGTVFATAEIYNPKTGTWSPTGSMSTPREFHDAVRLSNGKVLVAGDGPCCSFLALSSAEIFDPATGSWTPTGSMATTRSCCKNYLTLLSDGRVMAAAAYSGNGFSLTANGTDAEIYDPVSGTWGPTGNMIMGHSSGTFTLLGNGMVLAVGGFDGTTAHGSAELWNPATGTWSATVATAGARASHSAIRLRNGRVLVVGGYDGASCCLSSAELYQATKGP